jgi:hypothetical protein
LIDDDEAKKMVDDALYKLEYSVKDELRSKEALPILTQLQVCLLLSNYCNDFAEIG